MTPARPQEHDACNERSHRQHEIGVYGGIRIHPVEGLPFRVYISITKLREGAHVHASAEYAIRTRRQAS